MHILFIEPYDTGSHASWMRGYQRQSKHNISILGLEGQFWQWRLLGGAVTLAEQYRALEYTPDIIVASDMLDLTTFIALAKPSCPVAIYFHENQLLYPRGPRQKLQNHYAFINYTSALAADSVLFNSVFHQEAFLEELPRLLKHFPDHNNLHTLDIIANKSQVLPIGVDLHRFDDAKPIASEHPYNPAPLILWNHRWDYDKNATLFIDTIIKLAKDGYDFRVAVTGENFQQDPHAFMSLQEMLGSRVVQLGYVEQFSDYAQLLWEADIVVSTAIQEFFGISTVEALYCGCWPILPNRLNYPHLLPTSAHQNALYTTDDGLYHRLAEHILHNKHRAAPACLREHVAIYDWRIMAQTYDSFFNKLLTLRAD